MKVNPLIPTAALIMAFAGASAQNAATPIGPGSPAPALSVKEWFKGTPVKELQADKVYVIEFWATWCGPCRASIPHITKLAKKHKDVTFIGVSIWEENEGGNIAKFVAEMGDQMDYVVGYSGNQDGMAESWMKAAGQNGIPSAFIVKNKVIQWVGHPMQMDEPLAKVLDGSFDVKKARAEFDAEMAERKMQQEAEQKLQAAATLYQQGKKDEANKALDELASAMPMAAPMVDVIRATWMAVDDPAGFDKYLDDAFAGAPGPETIQRALGAMEVGMRLAAGRPAKKDEAAKVAAKAMASEFGKKDVIVAFQAALIFARSDKFKEALAAVDVAIQLLPNSPLKDNAQAKQVFEQMRKDLAERTGS